MSIPFMDRRISRVVFRACLTLGLGCGLAAGSPLSGAAAQGAAPEAGKRLVENPPLLERAIKASRVVMPKTTGLKATAEPKSQEELLDLDIVYTRGQLYNPATGLLDEVNLRSYQGDRIDPEYPFISPRIEVDPGDTIRITLNNQLPADPSCLPHEDSDMNVPHCFNGTNLHTHGLWVNPGGNGDNVLISINPGVSFQYEYLIPSDHPAGTFWYHTHRHGSTALQVSSGMAGALIVRGNRPPTPTENGDVDVLLRPTATQSFTERILVLQQIQYACRNPDGSIKKNPAPDNTYLCEPGDVGAIESYDLFGPGAWAASGRYTTINGRVLPTFADAKAGKIERWRVIHGGVRDTINLEFRQLMPTAADPQGKASARGAQALAAAAQDAFIGQSCTGEALAQHLIAADGLTTAAATKSTSTVFQPAYRWDALMVFPKAGTYCVIDGTVPASGNVDPSAPPSRRLLGFVEVGAGTDVPGDLTAYLQQQLVAAAQVNIAADVRGAVVADLENGLQLTRFLPHPSLLAATGYGSQKLEFNIDTSVTPNLFEVDDEPYKADRLDRVLELGKIDEWTLTSGRGSHPFHIHINPFQVVAILDPNGRDVSGPDAVDDYSGSVDPQYRGLKGVFKDSLWVKNATAPGGTAKTYQVVVRSKYERYIGDFVLHCHILDHEDQGMMQNVRIVLPDGAGGNVGHGHH